MAFVPFRCAAIALRTLFWRAGPGARSTWRRCPGWLCADGRLILAMVGESGAVKTSVAAELANWSGGDATVLRQDDHLLAVADRPTRGLWAKYDCDGLHAVLLDLIASRSACFSPFDPALRVRSGERVLDPRPLLILEGVTVLYCSLVRHANCQLRPASSHWLS
jgi:hypothetical protein